jgi:hypothetical protein
VTKLKGDIEEGIEMTLSSSVAILDDEMEGQYRYAIVKGLIEQIPLTSTFPDDGRSDYNDGDSDGDKKFDRYEITQTSSTDTDTTALSGTSTSGNDSDSSTDQDEHGTLPSSARHVDHHNDNDNYRRRHMTSSTATSSRSTTDNLRLPSFEQRMDIVNSLAGVSHQMTSSTIPLQRRHQRASLFASHDIGYPSHQQQQQSNWTQDDCDVDDTVNDEDDEIPVVPASY